MGCRGTPVDPSSVNSPYNPHPIQPQFLLDRKQKQQLLLITEFRKLERDGANERKK